MDNTDRAPASSIKVIVFLPVWMTAITLLLTWGVIRVWPMAAAAKAELGQQAAAYFKFASVGKFISSYWRFLQRDVYRGWTEHTGSSAEFISFLLEGGCTRSNTCQNQVLSLVPRAAALLT